MEAEVPEEKDHLSDFGGRLSFIINAISQHRRFDESLPRRVFYKQPLFPKKVDYALV